VFGLAACSNTNPTADNGGITTDSTSTPNSVAGTEPLSTGVSSSKTDLIVAISGEPTTLDPYAHSLYYGFIPATLIFDTLISKDKDGNFIPKLATEWKFVDDITLDLKLREGVTFQNGDPFTAEDVKFTLATAAASSFSSTLFASIDLDNTKVIDTTNIEIKLKYPYAPLLDVLSSYRSSIVDKKAYEADPVAFGRNPIGTGPMEVSNWVTGDRIELTTNENYWGDKLAFNKCVFRVIVEASQRTIELETGGVDIAVDIPFSDWTRISESKDMQLVKGQTYALASLVFNNSNDFFKDIRVRQALAYGLDLNALVKTVWEGTADVADSYYAKSLLGYKQEGPMEYNMEKAKTLLAERGYPNGFTFTYTTYQTTLNQDFAVVLQNMWKEIGVTMNIEIVDLATFTSMNNSGKLTASLLTPNVPVGDPAAALILWPINRTISLRHNDNHIQELLDKGSSTYDTNERITVYQELQDYLFANTYTVPIAYPTFALGIRNNVKGFSFDPSQVPNLKTVSFSH
jgi:peptide/nickel transport system substrate-binding protein